MARLAAENAELRRGLQQSGAQAEELQQRLAQSEAERQVAVLLCAQLQQQFHRVDRHLYGLLELIWDPEAEQPGAVGVGGGQPS
jgi:hypothetical protein